MKHMTTADMVSLIIERAKANEKMAAKSKNLKSTFRRYIRKGFGVQTAAATELAKRVNSTGDAAMLEQENLRLRVRLFELEQKLAEAENATPLNIGVSALHKRSTGTPPRADNNSLCPSPVAGETEDYEVSTRTTYHERSTKTPVEVIPPPS